MLDTNSDCFSLVLPATVRERARSKANVLIPIRVGISHQPGWLHCLFMNGLYTGRSTTLSLPTTVESQFPGTRKPWVNTSVAAELNSNTFNRKLLVF